MQEHHQRDTETDTSTPDDDRDTLALQDELEELRSVVRRQADELEAFYAARPGDGPKTSRRDVLKGAGVVGGLAALALGSGIRHAPSAEAVEGYQMLRYRGQSPAYLWLTLNGTNIPGEATLKGFEGSIECFYQQGQGDSPVDSSSGTVSGGVQYQPIVMRKRLDRTTPLLYRGMAQNESARAEFKFFRPTPTGATEHYFTVLIDGGPIIGVNNYLPEALGAAANANVVPALEEVRFTYQKITWTYVPEGISFSDDTSSTSV